MASDKSYLYWLRRAYFAAKKNSDDPLTPMGAVLVPDGPAGYRNSQICYGVNRLPKGVSITAGRTSDPLRAFFMGYAINDVIYKAALRGISTHDGVIYVPFGATSPCARGIIQAGIRKVVSHQQTREKSAIESLLSLTASIENGDTMLREAGIRTEQYDGKLFDGNFQIKFEGTLWTP